ncbi:PREDICTED: core-binding factor subunit beta [Calidris pugnax]|uniref:core-binding factor subunit beta n=1 Tax=Calidris pugnax TaxID=198806 RepID=UPI00071DA831|nr:PREDICTED: core-binding factor subunit beta [Calidris pugnax]
MVGLDDLKGNWGFNNFSVGRVPYVLAEDSKGLGGTKADLFWRQRAYRLHHFCFPEGDSPRGLMSSPKFLSINQRSKDLQTKAFVATGTNLSLQFFPASWQGEQRQTPTREYVDFEREGGKVYLKAPMILNGVCVIWKGWIDLQRLDGMGCLEFDEERAQQEDALAQQAFEEARRRTREFEDRDRSHREEMEVRVSQLLSVTGKKTARP